MLTETGERYSVAIYLYFLSPGFFYRNDRACSCGWRPEKVPCDHALGRAEGGHCPGGEQPKVKQNTGPGKQWQARMLRQLRCSGNAGADRKGEGPIGKGKFHVSVLGQESKEDRQAGPKEDKPENGYTVQHGEQFKAKGYFCRDRTCGNGAQDAGGSHGLS